MKAMLYMPGKDDPVAVLEEVSIVQMNDNHKASPTRITYKSRKFNAGKVMLEMHRDVKMTIKLDDGRNAEVLLQHTSLDQQGNAVGVLRVLDTLTN